MSILKWLKGSSQKKTVNQNPSDDLGDFETQRRDDDDDGRDIGRKEDELQQDTDGTKFVFFTYSTPKQNLLDLLQTFTKDPEVFTDETECIEYIKDVTNKVFLIIDSKPTGSLIKSMEDLTKIDSVFVYAPTSDSIKELNKKQHSYIVNWCQNDSILNDSIQKSREELDKQTAAFSMYNKKEKATRDLSKESGSFLFFQLFKSAIQSMPKTDAAKETMVTTCRNYYRGNLTELANIEDFDKNYKSKDAIPWYTKETFVYKFINKALRTEDIDVLYQFRFYILDLSYQLELKFLQLKEKQKDILRLYRGLKLTLDEVKNFQTSIGNLISTNGYLSTSSEHSVAYAFATKPAKRLGVVKALFEYQVDLSEVTKIVIADIREFSAFPEEAEVLVDIGASFQIDACEYDPADDLWHIRAHATDLGAQLAAEYMEYQKKKLMESNIVLMFGNLLLEMGEYAKAERYFDTILNSANPNDEEIACIFFNFGRTHRLKGDFNQAIKSYNRAYDLHMDARPKRCASAGKTLNGLGVVYSEQGRLLKAEECFQMALELYKKSIPKKHVDVAGTLVNLGVLDCERQHYAKATARYIKAKKIYDRLLPPGHPNRAMTKVNLGNVYLAAGQYELALEEYEGALKLQEASLPGDHPDIARTLHNLAVVQIHRGNLPAAKEYLTRAEETATKTLAMRHPVMTLLDKTKNFMIEEEKDYIFTRH